MYYFWFIDLLQPSICWIYEKVIKLINNIYLLGSFSVTYTVVETGDTDNNSCPHNKQIWELVGSKMVFKYRESHFLWPSSVIAFYKGNKLNICGSKLKKNTTVPLKGTRGHKMVAGILSTGRQAYRLCLFLITIFLF